MNDRDPRPSHIWFYALGYFLSYIPYSGLTKALSSGRFPGAAAQASLVLLPATAVATTAALIVHLLVVRLTVPRGPAGSRSAREWAAIGATGLATAGIIAATTLSYTFGGISILLALMLMRGGVLVLGPLVDKLSGRNPRAESWAALALSLAAIGVALGDLKEYTLSDASLLNLGVYLGGYAVRLNVLTRLGKSHDARVKVRYLRDECLVAAVALTAIPGALALWGRGPIGGPLREGFLLFGDLSQVGPGLLIGVNYAVLYQFGTRIYLDPRENTWCVPLNRGVSLLSGVISSYLLAWLLGLPTPAASQFAGTVLIMGALACLALPYLTARRLTTCLAPQQVFLFICGGNTSRSPMAQAICTAEMARWLGLDPADLEMRGFRIMSAGLSVEPGQPMTSLAIDTLRQLDVAPQDHASRPVTADLVEAAQRIFCMTQGQLSTLAERFPECAGKIVCLDPEGDLPDPSGRGIDDYRDLGRRLQGLIRRQIPNFV